MVSNDGQPVPIQIPAPPHEECRKVPSLTPRQQRMLRDIDEHFTIEATMKAYDFKMLKKIP